MQVYQLNLEHVSNSICLQNYTFYEKSLKYIKDILIINKNVFS